MCILSPVLLLILEGAAAATVLSRFAELAIVAVWTHRHAAQNPYITGAWRHLFTFPPTIVALPSKAPDADGVIKTDDSYGPWLTEVSIAMKPTPSPLYGSLRINKRVTDFAGEPATFVFHIVGTTPDGKKYENDASIYYTGGESQSTTVTHIPAGTKLTVTESYTGARYELVTGDDAEKTIVADIAVKDGTASIATANFTNKPNGSGLGGHGIENNFKLADGAQGDQPWSAWEWKAVPEQSNANGQQ